MKIYDDKHIKNVTLGGASKSGKTTLAEAMLFEAGLINRRGTVEEKNTVSDYHKVEHERGSSVYATSMHTEWKDYKINIIDTPALDDFIGEVISSLRVADTAVMIMNAEKGVEIGSKLVWNYVEISEAHFICHQSPRSFQIGSRADGRTGEKDIWQRNYPHAISRFTGRWI